MKNTIVLLGMVICSVIGYGQNLLQIQPTENQIVLGPFAGNRDLAFGVQNILEEIVQDKGYDLATKADLSIKIDLLYFDVVKNNIQIAAFGKQVDITKIVARATLYKNEKKKKIVNAKGQAKSISTSTLVIDEGGEFSQANVSTAIKKLCEDLIDKLKL
jgi:hypothetical protein